MAFLVFVIIISVGASGTSSNNISPVEYSTGEIVNSIYYNEWADLKITILDGYSNANEERYTSASSETTDFLLIIQESLGSNMVIQTELIGENLNISESDDLNELSRIVKEEFEAVYADFVASGWSVYEQYDSVDTQIESGCEDLISFGKNGMIMSCFVYNADISIQTVDKCVLSGILSINLSDNEDVYVYIPGGFKVGEEKRRCIGGI